MVDQYSFCQSVIVLSSRQYASDALSARSKRF
nr:MAG TPA: hypothetical protein [Bacteriophage sp.]